MTPLNELPDPASLEMAAEAMPPKVHLSDYDGAMNQLREKGYSYSDIAEWLTKRLGVEVRRGQVYWILNGPPDDALDDTADAAKEAEEGS